MNKTFWKLECQFHSARVVISFVWPTFVSAIRKCQMPKKALSSLFSSSHQQSSNTHKINKIWLGYTFLSFTRHVRERKGLWYFPFTISNSVIMAILKSCCAAVTVAHGTEISITMLQACLRSWRLWVFFFLNVNFYFIFTLYVEIWQHLNFNHSGA